MKVLFIINGLGTGGAERSLSEMLPELERADIEPIVACFYRRHVGVESHVLRRQDVRFIGSSNVIARARAIRRLVTSERPDVVHTTILEAHLAGRLGCAGTDAVVLSSIVSTPYVSARLQDPRIRRGSLAAVRFADGWTARHLTDHFHAITHAVKAHAVEVLGLQEDRVTVIERGREAARLGEASPERRRRARRALGLSDDDEVLVALGREEYPKGHRFLLDAVAELAPRRPHLVALVAGRGGIESASLDEAHLRYGLGSRFRRLGHREDVPELLAAADIFVFPSLLEGLGGALIEAMALHLPIVASDIPAIREVIENGVNATLVPPGSGTEIAHAVEALLDSPERARAYGARSRAIFEERFTLERSSSRMIELYRELVDGVRPSETPTEPAHSEAGKS